MALVNFKRSTEAKILSAPISDGTFYVSTDTKKLYVDIDTKRVEITTSIPDIEYSQTDLEAGVSELAAGKLYFVYE